VADVRHPRGADPGGTRLNRRAAFVDLRARRAQRLDVAPARGDHHRPDRRAEGDDLPVVRLGDPRLLRGEDRELRDASAPRLPRRFRREPLLGGKRVERRLVLPGSPGPRARGDRGGQRRRLCGDVLCNLAKRRVLLRELQPRHTAGEEYAHYYLNLLVITSY